MRFVAPQQSIKVTRSGGFFTPALFKEIRVRNEGPFTVMLFGDSRIELTTPAAHKLAWALHKEADLCIREANDGVLWKSDFAREFVVMEINGAEINLPAQAARKLAVALFRRNDAVDDWQIAHKARIVR